MAVSRDGSAAEMLASIKARSKSADTKHCNVNLPFNQKLEFGVAVKAKKKLKPALAPARESQVKQ